MQELTTPLRESEARSALLDFSRSGAFRNSQLLTAFVNSSVIGIAIVDNKLRFEAINDTLARKLGISKEADLGKTVRKVLGSTAKKLEPVLRKVFSKGLVTPSFEITDRVPLKSPPVGWTQAVFPIKNASGVVTKACLIIIQDPEPALKRASPAVDHKLTPTVMTLVPGAPEANRRSMRSVLFQGLDDSAYNIIMAAGRPMSLSRGELFCRQGLQATRLYLFTAGRAKLTGSTSAGKEVLIGWTRTGDILGVGTLLTSSPPYCWTASAVENCSTLVWDRPTIRGFADCWPSLFENGLQVALQWALQLQERFEEIATEMVEQRLAHCILRLSPTSSTVAELHISDEELSNMIGTNLFSVNRILNRWQKLGYLRKMRKRVLIHSRENILWIAEHGPGEPMPSTYRLSLDARA